MINEESLYSPKNRGTLIVRAEAVKASTWSARFSFKWLKVNNLSDGFFGICCKRRKSVRFEIGREIPGTSNFAEIYATDWIKQRIKPDFILPTQQHMLKELCNNNRDARIRFSIWVKAKCCTREHIINEVFVSINELENE